MWSAPHWHCNHLTSRCKSGIIIIFPTPNFLKLFLPLQFALHVNIANIWCQVTKVELCIKSMKATVYEMFWKYELVIPDQPLNVLLTNRICLARFSLNLRKYKLSCHQNICGKSSLLYKQFANCFILRPYTNQDVSKPINKMVNRPVLSPYCQSLYRYDNMNVLRRNFIIRSLHLIGRYSDGAEMRFTFGCASSNAILERDLHFRIFINFAISSLCLGLGSPPLLLKSAWMSVATKFGKLVRKSVEKMSKLP